MSKIYVPSAPDFENHPTDESPYQMVCCDVIDAGWLPREFQGEYKGHAPNIRLVFQSLILAQNGERMTIRTFNTAMLWSDKSKWYATVKAWLGQQALNKIIASGDFDAESLIGMNALVAVEERESKTKADQKYSNIESIAKWPRNFGAEIDIDPQYIRMCLREKWTPPQFSAFEDWSGHFAPEPSHAPPTAALRHPQPQTRQPVLSALQMIIAAAQRANPADVLVSEQVFTILRSQGYDKRIIPAEDQNVCEELVLNFLKHNEPPIIATSTRAPAAVIDAPAPGQTRNAHDAGAYARTVAESGAGDPPLRGARQAAKEEPRTADGQAFADDWDDSNPDASIPSPIEDHRNRRSNNRRRLGIEFASPAGTHEHKRNIDMGVKELRERSRDVNYFKVENTEELEGFNLRDDDEETRAHIAALAKLIDDAGHIIVPLVGIFNANTGKVRIIEGHCRRLAAIEVNKTRDAETQVLLPIVSPESKVALNEIDLTCMMLNSNSGRRFSAIEQSKAVRRLSDMGVEPAAIVRRFPEQTIEWVMGHLRLSTAMPETIAAIKAGEVSATAVQREIAATDPATAAETVKAAVSTVKAQGGKKASQRVVETHRPSLNGAAPKSKPAKADKGSDVDKALALLAILRAAWPKEAVEVSDEGGYVITFTASDSLAIADLLETN